MSKYIEKNLGRDEEVVLEIKKSILYLIFPFIILVLSIVAGVIFFSFYMIIIGAIIFLYFLLKFLTINLAVTNKRVIGKVGIISINALDMHIEKIDHVQVQAGLLGRLFKYYSLKVISVGGAGYNSKGAGKSTFVGIKNAHEFKNIVTEAIEKHAEEARKAQAEEIARAMGR